MDTWGWAQWSSSVLLVLGAALTTGAAVSAYRSAGRQRDRLEGQLARWKTLRADHDRQLQALEGEARIAERRRLDAIEEDVLPTLAPTIADAGRQHHYVAVRTLTDQVQSFRSQGITALVGLWLGTVGGVVGLLG